ncbi:uncharacterized protein [Antedon mediterranea]|uniref:uncharacterized protein n=1 Tax=Antedon mediterranea TaxID=105859 RepID=UPI003AF8557D
MPFLRRLSRTKSGEYQDQEEQPDKSKEKVKRRSYSGSLPVSKELEKQPGKERKASVKDKKKSKSEPADKYPLFYVHYLGRVPTKLEYGHEAIEGPVDQLCQLREKEKLQKLVLTFNMDGLFFREITGPFNRIKKDGMFIYIPLHMVTYGVGSVAHPNVFACVTRTAFDKASSTADMYIVHAFLCDKPTVAQKMTYWQLQAYIEAYETLKRRKELRLQRKLSRNSLKADSTSIKTSTTTVSGSSREGSVGSRDSGRRKLHGSTFVNPNIPKEHKLDDSKPSSKKKTNGNDSPIYAQVKKTTSNSMADDERTGEFTQSDTERKSATSIGSRTSKDSALGDEITCEQANDTSNVTSNVTKESDSSIKATTSVASSVPVNSTTSDASLTSGATATSVPSSVPTTDTSDEGGKSNPFFIDDNFDTISVVTMPIDSESVPRDEAFEKRISELNKLMQVDAEDLKAKLIKDNPTLVRRLYYGTIDRHGVFHRQGLNIGADADTSFA